MKLGINLTKYVQYLYAKNYKTLMKEIDDLNEEIYYVPGSEDFLMLSVKLISRFKVILIKIPACFLGRIWMADWFIYSQSNLKKKKKNKPGGFRFINFKAHYEATIVWMAL